VIVFLHQAGAYGAVESYLASILRELDEEAVVIAPASEALAPIAEVAELRSYDPALPVRAMLARLVRELRSLHPRLVHVVDVWPLAFIAARLARVPRLLVTHHTPELPRHDNAVGRILWWVGWLARPEVIYTSAADRERDRRSGTVISLGIDLARFQLERPGNAGSTVGTVSRLVPQKGLDTLVAAAPGVLACFQDARFLIVGEGELRAELEAAASGLPFEFTGAREDVPALLARFDVFVLPSRFEGLCLAVIEAQAAGVPVVATPVGGIVENVVPGETGILVPVDDAAALADAICEVLGDPEGARKLATEARRRVLERYDARRMVEQTLALYA
jgi:glycosyltransferase involved in cell wall biosynthesis